MNRCCSSCGSDKFLPIMRMIPYQEINHELSLVRPDGVECHGCGQWYQIDEEGRYAGLENPKQKEAAPTPAKKLGKGKNSDRPTA